MDKQPENQFDFWLGEWDATWSNNEKGTNRVERILSGKIIRENFVAPDLEGMSVSAYDPERSLWCQTWVDNNGTYLDFTGNFEDGQMILARDAIVRGEACRQRMVWYDIQDEQFEWNWERSDDGGQTWRVLWQIHYVRR
ncbi:MAG TPA: hypothetical protein VK249_02835 [Anaerolineales bacterium]|nr:hypothetical protein [Anaerolineales bacterium]